MSTYEEIVINKVPRKLLIETRTLSSLTLDPENPRFRHERLIHGKMYTDEELEAEIWKENDTKELFNAIKASGGLTEAPIITDGGLVKEGNRRVVCLRHLRNQVNSGKIPAFKKGHFDNVSVKVLPKDIPSLEIDVLLARFHVSGRKEWAAINQAEHIVRLTNEEGLTVERVAELLGKSKPYIYEKKYAYEKMLEYLKEHPDRTINDFSYFTELYKKKKEMERVGLDEDLLTDWIAKEKFNDEGARDIRELPAVLDNPNAKKAFLDKGMKAAKIELAKSDPSIGSPTFGAVRDTIKALREMPKNEYEGIQENKGKLSLLKELYNELSKIFTDLEIEV